MALKSRNQVDPNFNMSSLTDIIFLLLIFFMLTSTLVSPNALDIVLPSSNSQTVASPQVSVSIDRDGNYFVNTDPVSLDQLEAVLTTALAKEEKKEHTVVLNAEKSTELERVVKIMDIANKMKVKMILATNPSE